MFGPGATVANTNQRRELFLENPAQGQFYGSVIELDNTGNIWTVVGLFAFLGLVAWVSTWLAPQHSDEAPVTQSFEPRLDTTAIRTDKEQ